MFSFYVEQMCRKEPCLMQILHVTVAGREHHASLHHVGPARWTSHEPPAEMKFGGGLLELYYFLLRIYTISCIHENEYDYELNKV